MGNTGFDPTDWGHWALVSCFCAIAAIGLYLSWQWRKERLERKAKASLIRRLIQTVHDSPSAKRARHITPNRTAPNHAAPSHTANHTTIEQSDISDR
ncbi:MAG: hypothetical protein AAFZ17_04230 [Cyanobacteria bacterium J06650_10]